MVLGLAMFSGNFSFLSSYSTSLKRATLVPETFSKAPETMKGMFAKPPSWEEASLTSLDGWGRFQKKDQPKEGFG
jgi:hypothetical protein